MPTDGLLKRVFGRFLRVKVARLQGDVRQVYRELLPTVEKAGSAIFTQRIRGSNALSVMGVYRSPKGIS